MLPIEMYFNETIAQFSLFRQAAASLVEEIPDLTPEALLHRCEELSSLYNQITQDREQLFLLMEFVGPGILDTVFIGEFQRVLEKSILACDSLYAEICTYREGYRPCAG